MKWKKGTRLKLVGEAEASVPVRAIFDEVRHCLGVPVVPLLYQAYAAMPEFLQLHWRVFKPVLQTRQFFLLGNRLAAEAYTRAQSYFDIPDLRDELGSSDISAPGSQSILQVLDYYQYLNPLLLLITVAQMQAFEGTVGQNGEPNLETGRHPEFAAPPQLAADPGEGSAVDHIWEARRRSLNLAFVPEEHRALAMWPALYQRWWQTLQNLVQSPLYADCQFRIGESAWGLVNELPVQLETEIPSLLEAGLSVEEVSSLTQINESLITAFTSLLLDVTFTRIAQEGGSHAPSGNNWHESGAASKPQRSSQAA